MKQLKAKWNIERLWRTFEYFQVLKVLFTRLQPNQINAKEFFKPGMNTNQSCNTSSKEDRKMSLSIKQMTEDPWNTQ